MSYFLLPICYFLQNGISADDIGLILAGGAVLILMIGVTCRAMRVVSALLIMPAADLCLIMLVGVVLDPGVGEPASADDPVDLALDDLVADPEA
ncbi:hypothetical protein BJY52DRAFT_1245998 [Lactarius psammicola]|nr:hypothetical protein BJY52DRAFT_1245998 [Lactarius psammicola]